MDDELDEHPDLNNLVRFTAVTLALGVPPNRVVADFQSGLEDLRQRGSLSLEQLADVRSKVGRRSQEHATEWTEGFVAGYVSAWGAAVLRVLETRGIPVSTEIYRALSTCPDADALTRFLDRAVTVTDAMDLFNEPSASA
ncbi:hypothetical protein [Streptomyces sp. GESEQ-35]|uniref:hypothetical protein n=1 Tax=Streptomyces sp. GESEQ-35 TaxID=2812657 RepID=UPI001B331DB5|nr:hypothetical protein [Streptomyces sp. GESEQ-35]